MRMSITAATLALVLTAGCGSTEEPDAAVIIIMDDGAPTDPTVTNDEVDPAANNAETDPAANNTTVEPDPDPDPTPDPDPDPDPDPTPDPDPDPDPLEPCGNGVIEAGEMCDGNCPTSCDDGDPCTRGTLSGTAAACTAVCEVEADTACDAWEGSYTGSYYVKAEEKVGSSVINSMTCTGTFTADIDTSRADTLMGTATCTYPGSLTIFDRDQSATITGKIGPDGTFTARIRHDSGAPNDGNFTISGSIQGTTLTVDATGSYRPHPQSAVGWETIIKLN